jgi:hypothetical protein
MSIKDLEVIQDEMKKIVARIVKLNTLTKKLPEVNDITELLKSYADLTALHEQLNEARKIWYKSLEHTSRNVIPDRFMDADVKSMNIDGYGRFQVGSNYSVKVLDDVKSKDWLKENGGEDLIKDTVNSSSLKAWMKAYKQDQGMSPPEEIFSESISSYTQIQKTK